MTEVADSENVGAEIELTPEMREVGASVIDEWGAILEQDALAV